MTDEVVANGVRLTYDVHGEGPPVLLICGTGQPAALYSATLAPTLNEAGRLTVVFDNRGMPPSDVPPPPYTVEEMAEDAIALMEHLDLGPCSLIGSSLGGLIAQTATLKRPDLVTAVVFNIGCGNYSPFAKRIGQPATLALFSMENPPPELTTALYSDAFVPPTAMSDEERIRAAAGIMESFLPSDRDGLLGQHHANSAWGQEDHLDELSGIDVPALAIAHEWDRFFPPVLVQQAASRMGAEYVEVAGAAHVSFEPAHIETTQAAIIDFLQRHVPVN